MYRAICHCYHKIIIYHFGFHKKLIAQRTVSHIFTASYRLPLTVTKAYLPITILHTELRITFTIFSRLTYGYHTGRFSIDIPHFIFSYCNFRLIYSSRFTYSQRQFRTIAQNNFLLCNLSIIGYILHLTDCLILRVKNISYHRQIIIQQFHLFLNKRHPIFQVVHIIFQIIRCTTCNGKDHQEEKYIQFYVLHNLYSI